MIRELSHHDDAEYSVCVSAQHRAMLDQVLDLFEMQPDHDVDLMTETQSPSQVASALLARMSRAVNPYGDGQASRRIVASLLGQPTDEFAP